MNVKLKCKDDGLLLPSVQELSPQAIDGGSDNTNNVTSSGDRGILSFIDNLERRDVPALQSLTVYVFADRYL